MIATVQIKRGIAANWASTNPVLAAGEWGLETDTGKVKLGNGTTAWNSLSYKDVDVSGKQDTSEKGAANGYAGLDSSAKVAAGNLPDATTTNAGIIEIATDAEVTDGTDTSKAVTPKQLADKQNTSEKGAANGYAGLGADSKVSTTNLPEASSTAEGIIQIATDTEAEAGTVEIKAINPKQLQDAVSDVAGALMPTADTWKFLSGSSHTLPEGGTWAYYFVNSSGSGTVASVGAGGTRVISTGYPERFFVWKVA
jgi:hypothetical protein